MVDFKVDTPLDIDSMSEDKILELCTTFGKSNKPVNRARFIKLLYKEVLNFDLSKDLLYALTDEPKYQFILALAGGGKTTNIAVKIALMKIYRQSLYSLSGKVIGARVLSLVYNSANVKDVIDRHKFCVNKINALNIPGIFIDSDLNCRTFHSFALNTILKEEGFAQMLGLTGFKVLEPDASESMISQIAPIISSALGEELPSNFSPSSVLNIHNYLIETFSDIEDVKDSNIVVDSGLSIPVITGILKSYQKRKMRIRKIDHADSLMFFHKLLTEFPEARERVQKFFDVITADEIQDSTPILMDILKLCVGPHAVLICIGDDDQAIYGFRGADNKNALNFKAIFPDSKVHLLRTNRRCPSNVLNLADNVISLNEFRFKKEMRGVKGPGDVNFIGYHSKEGQYKSIVKTVRDLMVEGSNDTVIAYRETNSSYVLSILLHKNQIPFRTIRGYGPFAYGLFGVIRSVMNYAKNPKDKRAMLNLYKILPITKQEMFDALSYDKIKKEFTDGVEYCDFKDIEFNPRKQNQKNFVEAYQLVKDLPIMMHKMNVKEYMPHVINAIIRYHWNYMMSNSRLDSVVHQYCISFVYEVFGIADLYLSVEARIQEHTAKYKNSKYGVVLSTFHSLKGLEFDNVILCDLAESIFPNFSAIDFRNYDEITKQSLKEEENRLFYVAITRTKKNIWFYYDKQDPSYYISFLKDESLIQSRRAIDVNDVVIDKPVLDEQVEVTESNVFVTYNDGKEGEITSEEILKNTELGSELEDSEDVPIDNVTVVKVSEDIENPNIPTSIVRDVELKAEPKVDIGNGVKTSIKSSIRKNLLNRSLKK